MNQKSEVASGQFNNELKLIVKLLKARELQSQVINLCRFIAMSDVSHITHSYLIHCYYKISLIATLNYSKTFCKN